MLLCSGVSFGFFEERKRTCEQKGYNKHCRRPTWKPFGNSSARNAVVKSPKNKKAQCSDNLLRSEEPKQMPALIFSWEVSALKYKRGDC